MAIFDHLFYKNNMLAMDRLVVVKFHTYIAWHREQESLDNVKVAHNSSACMKAPSNKSMANERKEHTVEKYIQLLTMMSLTILV